MRDPCKARQRLQLYPAQSNHRKRFFYALSGTVFRTGAARAFALSQCTWRCLFPPPGGALTIRCNMEQPSGNPVDSRRALCLIAPFGDGSQRGFPSMVLDFCAMIDYNDIKRGRWEPYRTDWSLFFRCSFNASSCSHLPIQSHS